MIRVLELFVLAIPFWAGAAYVLHRQRRKDRIARLLEENRQLDELINNNMPKTRQKGRT